MWILEVGEGKPKVWVSLIVVKESQMQYGKQGAKGLLKGGARGLRTLGDVGDSRTS